MTRKKKTPTPPLDAEPAPPPVAPLPPAQPRVAEPPREPIEPIIAPLLEGLVIQRPITVDGRLTELFQALRQVIPADIKLEVVAPELRDGPSAVTYVVVEAWRGDDRVVRRLPVS